MTRSGPHAAHPRFQPTPLALALYLALSGTSALAQDEALLIPPQLEAAADDMQAFAARTQHYASGQIVYVTDRWTGASASAEPVTVESTAETVAEATAVAADTVEGLTGEAHAETGADPAGNKTSGVAQVQVQVPKVLIRAAASDQAPVVSEAFKGQLLDAFEQVGDWVRVGIRGSASGPDSGWVRVEVDRIGETNIAAFTAWPKPAPGRTRTAQSETGALASEVDAIRPGGVTPTINLPAVRDDQIAPPAPNLPRETVAIPDRWRLMSALGFKFPWYDPYNQNPLKGDLPVLGDVLGPEWFFNFGAISDTLLEYRRLPTPTAPVTSRIPGQNDQFGGDNQRIFAQTLITSFSLVKGNTTFRPPDYEFKFAPVFNYNNVHVDEDRALRIDPLRGTKRVDNHFAVQELFADVHLRNVSERYDFDSLRVGIQPITADFRSFLFNDLPFGVRVFGNRDNNQYQYNLGLFRRIEKDTNTGLNDIQTGLRDDDVFIANLYRQDFPVIGFTSQVAYVHNRNDENKGLYFNKNGFLERPASIGAQKPFRYRVNYFGYSGDGHFDTWNVSTSTYLARGSSDTHPIAQRPQDINAWFHATELSRDFSWVRVRGSMLFTSADKDPFDGKSEGFDAILENPQFAGADTSFFIRQPIPLIGGGGVALSGRNGVIPSLRSSKDEGQSNFINPGLSLFGIGADFDVKPELRLIANINRLFFRDTTVIGVLRTQAPPDRDIGTDISFAAQYRPFFTQNVIINASISKLLPGKGYRELFPDRSLHTALINVILTF